MWTRILCVAAVAMVAAAAEEARAQGWCGITVPGDSHNGKPECYTGPGVSNNFPANAFYARAINVCDATVDSEKIDVDLVYPSTSMVPGLEMTPIVFQHGGGLAPSFCDKHTNDTTFPFSCSPDFHYANPYGYMAEQLAHKGALVMFPIVNIGPGSTPYDDSARIMNAINCLGNRTSHVPGPGGCGEAGEPSCYSDLLGRVQWTPTNKQNVVFIGHSAGAVAGLYLPQRFRTALKSLILIDPSKAEYALNPPTGLNSGTPIVHIYPDWYGPLQNSANNLFGLGTTVTGPYVPIGIREVGSCDPDAGCHAAHHCTSLADRYSWRSGFNTAGHANYCNPNTTSCTNMKTPPAGSCPAGSTECGRDSICRTGPTKPSGATWSAGATYQVMNRYVVAYATCAGGKFGRYYQSWVNGRDREFDDVGNNGYECVGYDGQPDSSCTAKTTGTCNGGTNHGNGCVENLGCPFGTCAGGGREVCNSTGCHFAQGEDGKVVRVQNGQTATDYDYHANRYYGSAEGYSSSGTCVGGPNNGLSCTTDSFCGMGGNCTAGDFTERTEQINAVSTHARGFICQSGTGTF